MQFLSIIAAAAVAMAVAVPADLATKDGDRPKAVLLEIGKEYSYEELEHLKATAPAEPWLHDLSKRDVISKRYSAASLAVDGTWTCRIGGRIERLLVGSVTFYEATSEDGPNDAVWRGTTNIENWTMGGLTHFPPTDGIQSVHNTAVHNFCVHFVSTICTYQIEAGFVQFVRNFEHYPTASGEAAPVAPSMSETCVSVHRGEGNLACPAVSSGRCRLDSFE